MCKKLSHKLWQLVPMPGEWYSLGEVQTSKMAGDEIAEVVNIPAKLFCEQKAEELDIGPQ